MRHWMSLIPLRESDDSDPIDLLRRSPYLIDMGTYVSEGGIGFLLPDGSLLNDTEGMAHEAIAEDAGTSLDDLYDAGVARIYISDDFVGIEIWRKPTPAQVATLLKAIRANRGIERFAVDGAFNIMIGAEGTRIAIKEVQTALRSL